MTANAFIIIQARMGSTRFPGKSMSEINGRPILSIMMEQLSFCRFAERTIFAIPEGATDDGLAAYLTAQGWDVFRGPEDDVLDRFYRAAVDAGAEPNTGIVRLTGDDILPDPQLVDAIILLYQAFEGQFDYVCTDKAGRLPYGAGVEILSFRALETACREATRPHDREHVVPFVKWNPERFPSLELTTSADLSGTISLSIDRPEDLESARILFETLSARVEPPYSLSDILDAASALPL